MDAPGGANREDRTTVLDDEGVVAFEGRILISNDSDLPVAVLVIGLERWWRGLFVARAKGAGLQRFVLETLRVDHEGIRPLGSGFRDHYPPAGERIKAHLSHRFCIPSL